MKKKVIVGIVLIFAAFSLLSCADGSQNTTNSSSVTRNSLPGGNGNSAMNSNTMNVNSAVSMNDNRTASLQDNFWTKAAQGGMAEVELGQMASTKAQNAEVKSFAQKMVADHTKANTELKALAAKKSITLPTDVGSEHKSTMDDLKGLSGADFDKAYVEAMVEDHETDVKLFEEQAKDDSDADLKAFAAKTLPTLKSHLDMIKSIQSKMK